MTHPLPRRTSRRCLRRGTTARKRSGARPGRGRRERTSGGRRHRRDDPDDRPDGDTAATTPTIGRTATPARSSPKSPGGRRHRRGQAPRRPAEGDTAAAPQNRRLGTHPPPTQRATGGTTGKVPPVARVGPPAWRTVLGVPPGWAVGSHTVGRPRQNRPLMPYV